MYLGARLAPGKQRLWDSIVLPHLFWRPMHFANSRASFGAKFDLQFPDLVQSYIYFFGTWEPGVTKHIQSILSPGDTVIDVGANIGYFTLLASKCVGASGQVHAVEASPLIYDKLKRNIALNDAGNVSAHNLAATSEAGDVQVYTCDWNLGASTILPEMAARFDRSAHEFTVQGRTLADIVGPDTLCRARLIKIDVEGAEQAVISGIADLLPRMSERTQVLVEISGDPSEIVGIFADAGFSAQVIENLYTPSYYMQPAETKLLSVGSTDRETVDILFRRA